MPPALALACAWLAAASASHGAARGGGAAREALARARDCFALDADALADDVACGLLAPPEFAARADAAARASAASLDAACGAARCAARERRALRGALVVASRAAFLPALAAQLDALADAAADALEDASLKTVPGTVAYERVVAAAARTATRRFCAASAACVPRALRAPPLVASPLHAALRESRAQVRSRLGAEAERLVRLHPALVPPADGAAEKWYRRLAWQLLALALNLAQAQAQDWWARRAQRRRTDAARDAAIARGASGGGGPRRRAGEVRVAPHGPAF